MNYLGYLLKVASVPLHRVPDNMSSCFFIRTDIPEEQKKDGEWIQKAREKKRKGDEILNCLISRVTLEKAMAPLSSTLAWKLPWTEEPGRLQSMGSRRVGHD